MPETPKKTLVPSALILTVGVFFATSVDKLRLPPNPAGIEPQAIVLILTAYLLIVVFVEQACEVVINVMFGRKTNTASSAPFDVSDRTRFLVSQAFCVALAVAVALIGFRVLAQITPALGYQLPTDSDDLVRFNAVDTVLSALLLAGGAERFHQIIKGPFNELIKQSDNADIITPGEKETP